MYKVYKIYTVNNKAVKIKERYTHTYLVQYVKSKKYASVSINKVKSFTKKYNTNSNQLRLWN